MKRIGCAVSIAAGCCSIAAHAQISFIARLTSPHPETGSRFGAVTVDMLNQAAVAQPGVSSLGEAGVGAVYLFDTNDYGTAPVELRPVEPTAGAAFGTSMFGVMGGIVIGAPGASSVPDDPAPRGTVERWLQTTGWERQAVIEPPPNATGTEFGHAVAYTNSTILAGFPGRTKDVALIGGVLQFHQSGSDWTYEGEYSIPAGGTLGFGESVLLDGSRVIIGMPTPSPGAIAVYAGPLLSSGLVPPDDIAIDEFGVHGLWANGSLIVGVPYPHSLQGDPLPGRVYVYARNLSGSGYTLTNTVTAPDGTPGDGFGETIDQWSFTFAIGAPGMTAGALPGAGAVWLVDNLDFSPMPREKKVSTHPEENGHFGSVVSWKYGRLVIGAPGETAGGVPQAGAAYVFASDPDIVFNGSFDYD